MKTKCKTVVIEVETTLSNLDLQSEVYGAMGSYYHDGAWHPNDEQEVQVRSVYVKTDQAPKVAKKRRAKRA